jgi:hypothetical protein
MLQPLLLIILLNSGSCSNFSLQDRAHVKLPAKPFRDRGLSVQVSQVFRSILSFSSIVADDGDPSYHPRMNATNLLIITAESSFQLLRANSRTVQ